MVKTMWRGAFSASAQCSCPYATGLAMTASACTVYTSSERPQANCPYDNGQRCVCCRHSVQCTIRSGLKASTRAVSGTGVAHPEGLVRVLWVSLSAGSPDSEHDVLQLPALLDYVCRHTQAGYIACLCLCQCGCSHTRHTSHCFRQK